MKLLFALVGLLFFASCTHSPVAYEYQPLPADGWEPADTLYFTTDTLAEPGTYQLSVGLRTSTTTPYPYYSLWLVVHQDWQRPPYHQTDTIECRLANQQGDQTGNGITLYQYEFPVSHLRLEQENYAHIRIHHLMRNDLLTGVTEVGVKVEKVEG